VICKQQKGACNYQHNNYLTKKQSFGDMLGQQSCSLGKLLTQTIPTQLAFLSPATFSNWPTAFQTT
jgi:hypothetical protein